MSYSKFPNYEYEQGDFPKVKYLRFQEGVPSIVRVVSDESHYIAKHFLRKIRRSVLCLGDRCSICSRNKTLFEQHGRNATNQPDYIPIQNRNAVNVLDLTPVVVDEETGDEYPAYKGTFPTVTKDGERSLVDIQPRPSNTSKVLERGKRLFEQFDVFHNEYAHLGGIRGIDVKLVTLGAGKKMTISVVPLPDRNRPLSELLDELEPDDRVEPELSTLGIELTPDEMLQAASGIDLRDIFAARKDEDTSSVDVTLTGSVAEVEESVASLFDN
jgi:hypothetical protein